MEIIDEFSSQILSFQYFHEKNEDSKDNEDDEEDAKVVSIFCTCDSQVFVYKESDLFLTEEIPNSIFPLVALIYQDKGFILPQQDSAATNLSTLDALFVLDKSNIIGFAGEKLIQFDPSLYEAVCQRKNINIFDQVLQSVDFKELTNVHAGNDICLLLTAERGNEIVQSSLYNFVFDDSLFLALFGFSNFVKRSKMLMVFHKSGKVWFMDLNDFSTCTFLYSFSSPCVSASVMLGSTSSSFVCSLLDRRSFHFTANSFNTYTVAQSWQSATTYINPPNKCMSFLGCNCTNTYQAQGVLFIKDVLLRDEPNNLGLKSMETELEGVQEEIKSVKSQLNGKVQLVKFHESILGYRSPKLNVCNHSYGRLIVECQNLLHKAHQGEMYMHAVCYGENSFSTSITSTSNVLDMNFASSFLPNGLTMLSTINTYVIKLGSTDFDLFKMVKITEDQKDWTTSCTLFKRIFIHRSFIDQFKKLKLLFYGSDATPSQNTFAINVFHKSVKVSIKHFPGCHQLWTFSSSEAQVLRFIYNSHIRKVSACLSL